MHSPLHIKAVLPAVLCFALLGLASRRAAADDQPPRFNLAAVVGIANFERSAQSPSDEGGGFVGGTLRVHPLPMHGVFTSFAVGEGIFGPQAAVADAGYSLRLVGPRELHGPTGAIYLDVGPAVGFVGGNGTQDHSTLGGRFGVTAEARLAMVVLGLEGVYRGGLPLGANVPQQWEGMLSIGLHLGVVFDAGARPAATPDADR